MHGVPALSRDMLAFLLQLSDHLCSLRDPFAIQAAAVRLLGEQLGADKVVFSELRRGGTLSDDKAEWNRPGASALQPAISLSIERQDQPVATLLVHPGPEQLWSSAEAALASQVGERTWDAVERARAHSGDSARLLEAERVARIEADHALRAREESLATLLHELRTPLANIISWSRLLQTRYLKNEEMMRKGLDIISDNAQAQSRLLSGLMDASRIASGKFELEPEEVDLRELLDAIQAGFRPAAEARGVRLDWQCDAEPVRLRVDGARLRQVVDNLLSNALKFTPAGGTITLSCRRREDGDCVITVEDSGEGIDGSVLPRIFDRFSQGDSARSRDRGGLGLGLSIARQIVEMHGGRIEAHSDGPGRGARFTVTLPAQLANRRSPDDSFASAALAALHALEGVRVLAVEDQPDMRELLRRILEEHRAQVTVVESAAVALALLREHPEAPPFDVLISDIGLPVLDGNEFLRLVRSELNLDARVLPAIAVTAYARAEDRRRALAAGFQEHLTKPYGMGALVAAVRRLVRDGEESRLMGT